MKFVLPFLMLASTAHAADVPTKPPTITCGKTIEECQKTVDGLSKQLADASRMVQALRIQRNNALADSSERELNAYLQQPGK